MATDNADRPHLPNLPENLAYRIDSLEDELKDGEKIIGNGEIELTSEHPVSIVEYFLTVHVDEYAR